MIKIFTVVFHLTRLIHPIIKVGAPNISLAGTIHNEYQLEIEQIQLVSVTHFSYN
jgi:hypothetical protein